MSSSDPARRGRFWDNYAYCRVLLTIIYPGGYFISVQPIETWTMIRITKSIEIDPAEIREKFILASGSGGQNVNKVATAVQLRFNVKNSPCLPEDVRPRVLRLGGKRITQGGILIIDARRYRTRQRNRQDALDRFIDLIRRAASKPKPRRKTKPSLASKERRLYSKKRRGKLKSLRGLVPPSQD